MAHLGCLLRSFVTILRDYAFPTGFSQEGIRKAVQCQEDLTINTPKTSEQLQIAATLALLNSRLANTSAMIVVRTTKEAKQIHNFLNPSEINQLEQYEHEYDFSHRLTNSTIRVASTFKKFKGNCYPSSTNCIIITSYNQLLRNLLYRRSNFSDLKRKVSLPLVNAYIFVDPLNEKGNFDLIDLDSILFLKRKTAKSNKRVHFISPGILTKSQLLKSFQTKSIIDVTESNQENVEITEVIDTRDLLRSILPFQILLRSFSGHPTKKQLLLKLKDSINYRLQINETTLTGKNEELDKIIEEEFYAIFKLLNKSNKTLHSEKETFALISHGENYTGRYNLTPFGKRFLVASTYFEEIKKDPLAIITLIQEKISNNVLDWDGIARIFHTFTIGRIAYDDLQVLIEKLETRELNEDDAIFKSIFSGKTSYSFFKIQKLLSCYQEIMSEKAKKRFSLIESLISSNFDYVDDESGKKDKEAILQAINEELTLACEPITAAQIMLNLSLQKKEVTDALSKIELQSDSLQTVVVKPPKGRSVKYYSLSEIPFYYFKECGGCYYYENVRCNFWVEAEEIAERKIPEKYLLYLLTNKLRRKTVACEFYQEADTMEFNISIPEFYQSTQTEFVSFGGEDGEEFAHHCPNCLKEGKKVYIEGFGSRAFPQQGAMVNKCSRCGSSFKLIQEKIEINYEESPDEY